MTSDVILSPVHQAWVAPSVHAGVAPVVDIRVAYHGDNGAGVVNVLGYRMAIRDLTTGQWLQVAPGEAPVWADAFHATRTRFPSPVHDGEAG